MADTAAHLRDQVFPAVPLRQWVCTMPKRLRFLLAWKPKLISLALTLFLRALFAWQRRCARKQGIKGKLGERPPVARELTRDALSARRASSSGVSCGLCTDSA